MIACRHYTSCLKKALLFAALLYSLGSPVFAAEALGPVGIVHDEAQDLRIEEVRVRLRAELQTAGLTWVDVAGPQDLGHSPLGAPWALVFLVTGSDGIAVDIALPARGSARTTARRLIPVGVSSALTPAELALRAVEVLRAHVAAGPVTRFEFPPPRVVSASVAPPNISAPKFQMNLGSSGLLGNKGLGLGFGPAAAVAIVGPSRWGARISVSSAVLAGRAQGSDLTAETSQWLPTMDALFFFGKEIDWVRPYLSVGVGAFHLSAKAAPDVRLLSKQDARWAGAGVAGGGVSIGAEHLRIVVETKILVTTPSVAVDVAGTSAGVAGKPSGLCVVALSWTL